MVNAHFFYTKTLLYTNKHTSYSHTLKNTHIDIDEQGQNWPKILSHEDCRKLTHKHLFMKNLTTENYLHTLI